MREHYFPFATAPRFGHLREQMERVMHDLSRSSVVGVVQRPDFPRLNICEQDAAIVVEAEVPGVTQADVEVVATANELSIRGERSTPSGDDATYHRRERASGKFARTVQLSVDVDPAQVEASLDHGVLRIVLPKAVAVQPRTIPVSTLN